MNAKAKQPTEAVTDELITKKEVARRLKVCERKVELMEQDGRIPVIRLGRAIRYNWASILNALQG